MSPKWFIKAINKIRRAFLWKGRREVQGGCCLVAWEKVQRPLNLGGLGILNLEFMGWALQVRWLWLRKTDTSKPWLALDIPIHANVSALFQIALQTSIGSGSSTKFGTDRWIHGSSVKDLAPTVFAAVPTRTRNIRLVADALVDHRWARDIQGGLSLIGLYELFQLADILTDFVLKKMTLTFGDWMSRDSIQLSRHIWPFSMEQLHLNLGAKSGKLGHPQSAEFSCG